MLKDKKQNKTNNHKNIENTKYLSESESEMTCMLKFSEKQFKIIMITILRALMEKVESI